MDLYRLIGQKIRAARKEHNLGQKVLARTLGYTPSTISQYENGKRCILLTDLERLALALNRPLSHFITAGEQTKGEKKKAGPGIHVSLKQYKMIYTAHKIKKKLKDSEKENSKYKSKIKGLENKIQNLMARIAEQAQITNQTALLYKELKKSEEKAGVAEKISASHHATKNIAYQLNNPLTVLLGFIQMMLSEPNHHEDLERLEGSVKRCIKIIHELTESVLPPP